MKVYMFYLEDNEVKRLEREAVRDEVMEKGRKEGDPKWYKMSDFFPYYGSMLVWDSICNKIFNGDGKNKSILYILSLNPDYDAAIDVFKEYFNKKSDEYEENKRRLDEKLSEISETVQALNKQQSFLWMDELKFVGSDIAADGRRAIYFDGPAELLTKFGRGDQSNAPSCRICLQYPVDKPVSWVSCTPTIYPVYTGTENLKVSYAWKYIDLGMGEIEELIRKAEENM